MSSGRSAAGSSSSTLPTLHEGSIRRASLAEACALGLTSTVEFLIDLEDRRGGTVLLEGLEIADVSKGDFIL